ncbi:hypothetical protein AU184_22820 [Mycolicibacterium novocastrense]|uniref:DUF4407 domain-containing protein n=1 Tax=Mycolicibacterium novocastrense TaxID=59813 RepID=UPI00074A9BDE|nr:DUF4407 domain-containing protein [Mycolicibacterium novocastrense]KUH67862.1 hypothetical protein AU072_24890 [Mycolicibacterium novocastrense]KUH68335.1 hypothetical protein AU184_22820 [Mycolicibacterium novocastrense]KUH73414.1 hypothetical protein AU183_23710 [Mycolicibacterium novocastrense]
MGVHRNSEAGTGASPTASGLIWLSGGEPRDVSARHELSTLVSAGVVVLVTALLAWLVAASALAQSTSWPLATVIAVTSVFGLLIGALSRAIAARPVRGSGVAGRAAVAVAVGLVIGELAAVVVFSGSVDRLLDERAARAADSSPAVAQAAADVDRSRAARSELDAAVERAVQRRQDALVVARCEFNPRPECPQTVITGVPGAGPENRTANDFLADAQGSLDAALADRDLRAPALDAQIADAEQALAQARQAATTDADRGLGAQWVAMNDHTLANPGALVLRILVDGFFVLLSLLPLILRRWRGETSQDRGIAADVARDRAELEADTAVAVKRAEVRAAIDTMWAEQQLASARMAVEAQLEIDREQQRRRVIEAVDTAIPTRAERISEPEDVYLPIAAEAEAASLVAAEAPAPDVKVAENLPAPVEEDRAVEPAKESGRPLIPGIPDVTRAAARWIRPLVPPIIVNAIDTTTRPLRSARQVLEETEEIHFSMRRTRKVTTHVEEGEVDARERVSDPTGEVRPVSTVRGDDRRHDYGQVGVGAEHTSSAVTRGEGRPELSAGGTRELNERRGPRELPPGR